MDIVILDRVMQEMGSDGLPIRRNPSRRSWWHGWAFHFAFGGVVMAAFDEIMRSLKLHPQDWNFCNNGAKTLVHKNGLSIWIDNLTVINTNVYKPCPIRINLWQKYQLYNACHAVSDAKVAAALNGGSQ